MFLYVDPPKMRNPHWKYQKSENTTIFVPLLFLARGQVSSIIFILIVMKQSTTLQDIQERIRTAVAQ